MAEQKRRYVQGGRAGFRCQDHQLEQVIAWGPNYPPIEPPRCPVDQRAMEFFTGDHPAEHLEDVPESP